MCVYLLVIWLDLSCFCKYLRNLKKVNSLVAQLFLSLVYREKNILVIFLYI